MDAGATLSCGSDARVRRTRGVCANAGGAGPKIGYDGVAAAHTALTIDSKIAEAHLPMIRRLQDRRRYSEAEAEMGIALSLDPESWEVNKEAARVSFRKRDLDGAVRHLETAVSLIEADPHAWARLVTCYHALENRAALRNASSTSP